MSATTTTVTANTLRDIVVRRQLDAPLASVWRAFIEGAEVMKWWGPEGFTAPFANMDVREGGTSVVCMRSPDGQDFYSAWQYSVVVPERRLEYIFNLCGADGTKIDPIAVGMPPGFPRDVPHIVTFQSSSAGTELVVTERGYDAGPFYDLSKAGLEQCLDKLERALKAGRDR
jgi:uncharacterized protein YndB with AHSA1/START domain